MHDTKKKIIHAACELFAQQGYDGTSIREIASAADVNVAAVNYHLQNKKALFWEVFRYGYEHIEGEIKTSVHECETIEEATYLMFLKFRENWTQTSTIFRMILSKNLPESGEDQSSYCHGRLGPPGGEIIAEFMFKKLGREIPQELVIWGVRSIFTQVFHMAIVIETEYVKRFSDTLAEVNNEDYLKRSVQNHTQAIMNFIRQTMDEQALDKAN